MVYIALRFGKLAAKQGGLRQFAVKLGDFKLIGLGVVAQLLRHFNGFLPIAVLLVNIEQHFSGQSAGIAFF